MSGLLAVAVAPEIEHDDVELARLKHKVDLPALIARGWDPNTRVFAPAADDPLFGYYRCERVRCPRAGESRRARALGLCDPCVKNFYARVAKTESGSEPETLERFKTRPFCATTRPPRNKSCVWSAARPVTSGPREPRAFAPIAAGIASHVSRPSMSSLPATRGSAFRSRVLRSDAASLMTAGGGRRTIVASARSATGAG